MRGRVRGLLAPALALTLTLAAGSAWGYSYTNIVPPPEGEDSHLDIIETIYGDYGPFTANGLDFDNGAGITLKRVYDANTDPAYEILHVLYGDETHIDQIWTDGVVSVTAEVKFAMFNQSFGWNGGGTGTTYYELLTDADLGGPPVEFEVDGDFLWGIHPTWCNPPTGYQWWSRTSLNYDGDDHMVTYFVEGLPDAEAAGETVWLLFFEDNYCHGCDADYNDFVIEVRAVPEPGTFLLVTGGLTALALSRRRRRPTA